MSDYSVRAILEAVDRNFSRTMENAKRSTEGIDNETKKADSSIKGMGKAFLASNLAANAISAGLRAVGQNVGAAVNRFDTLNNARNVFTAMKFDVKEADQVTDYFVKTLDGLPTSMDQAISGTQAFAGVTKDLGYSSKVWNALNNSVLAFGGGSEEVSRITDALSVSLAKGTIDGQTFNQMLTAKMGPALEEMAARAGMSSDEFQEALKSGEISAEEFGEMLIDVSENGSESLEALKEVAKANTEGIGTAVLNIGNRISFGISEIFFAIDRALLALGLPSIAGMINAFSTSIANVFLAVAAGIDTAVAFIVKHSDTIQAVWSAVMDVFNNAAESIFGTHESMKEVVVGAYDRIIEVAQHVVEWYTGTYMAIFEQIAEWWQENQESFAEIVEMVWEAIMNTVGLVINTIVDLFMSVWEPISSWFKENQEDIRETVLVVWDAILAVIQFVIEEIVPIITTAWNELLAITNTVWQAIFPVIETAMNLILNIISFVMALIRGDWSEAWESIKEITVGFFELIIGVIDAALEFIKGVITGALTVIENVIDGALTVIEGVIDAALAIIKSVFSDIFNSLKGIVTDAFDKVKSAVTNGMNRAKSAVTDKFNDFKNAGKNIVENIADGIRSAVGKVTGAVKGVLKSARNLLPFSPPKDKSSPLVDIHRNGITEQIAKGIYSGEGDMQRAMRSSLETLRRLTEESSFSVGVGNLPTDFNRELGGQLSHQVALAESESRQPVQLVVQLGSRSYRQFIDDITDQQQKDIILDHY